MVKLATIEADYWRLRSGEKAHREHPDTFWIPPKEERDNLQVGQSVKLMFDIELVDENDEPEISGERMWVIVSERTGDGYIGLLDNQPASFEITDDIYLCVGAEIPFHAEHVIDIDDPPQDYAKQQLSLKPTRLWPRD